MMLSLCLAPLAASAYQKIKIEEILSRHLESVAPAETRESIKNRVVSGTTVVTFRAPGTGRIGGRAVIASQGEMSAVGMVFDNVTNYPQDKVGFDGKAVTASYIHPGVRSVLGDFLMTHKDIVKQGLLGGALSQAWPLYDLKGKNPKLEYGGTKKIGDRQAHEVKYFARGGSDLHVSLFFDAETFQHLRTEYTRTLAAQMGPSPETSAGQNETRYRMVEDFSDFRKESALTLPHVYKITLEVNSPRGSYKAEWEMEFSQFAYNQPLDPKTFNVDAGN
ncbi:MAG TPA: hypothetical protein VF538_15080 [Pyrinomonadaceae bacterium]|jgi:hypothetical protein